MATHATGLYGPVGLAFSSGERKGNNRVGATIEADTACADIGGGEYVMRWYPHLPVDGVKELIGRQTVGQQNLLWLHVFGQLRINFVPHEIPPHLGK